MLLPSFNKVVYLKILLPSIASGIDGVLNVLATIPVVLHNGSFGSSSDNDFMELSSWPILILLCGRVISVTGASITTAANWLMNFVISEIIPVMLASIIWGGRLLEEINAVFSGHILCHKSNNEEISNNDKKKEISTYEE
ncbi:uncharacterized protein BX663DRAFT_485071 [Cokeromyces recurvatus]|uniref:uncharacterized protein n=1 Tax=Cokeromyces recurvatus TaxID=90255 RepID=UPI0022206D5F|nr:uncharacterized protein BX663DRAFT_485071 [Cokeromyces recurvatus]KAI7904236.1 hypothetical protein BX663DRAFT_485071 [Cokeromyces recurvatus]